ncbi:hypothetical protein [Brevundimonas sp. R86498]|uniref:hypothetical protein n=1 Tax=Brevundimonas sp. R86498 TaxID=3093845 RepID=UPI0037CAA7F0
MKVFAWSDGFHAFTVAAPSRPAALKAWGVGQDLFKTGLAREAANGPDRDAALAAPGTVISRGLSVDVGKLTPAKPKPSNGAARARLKVLEAELSALDEAQTKERRALEARRDALDRKEADLVTKHGMDREALEARLQKARTAAG